ncbi:MAG: dihydrolipoamide acetyltransferase family protein [Ignavibacteria bacterium]|nr:dihydrolipoamide acetyltransferase family protein [Ignavibacteria bacterium]
MMLVDIIMPKMGESIMEGTILKWLKKPGDKVERDEPILEISTDKVDTEVPSPEAGIISELLFKENDVVEIGKILARLETDANAKIEPKTEEPAKEIKKEEPVKPVEVKPAETKPEKVEPAAEKPEVKEESSDGFFSPLVMNIAKKEGIPLRELESIKGTGLQGRVTKNDILNYIKTGRKPEVKETTAAPVAAKTEKKVELPKQEINYNEEGLSIMEFDNIRQKMAEHMVASVRISPHVNSIAECDMTNVEKARNAMAVEFEKKEGIKLTYMPFIAEAVIKALKDFPLINSIIDDSSVPFKAITRSKINLGFAVAMENGGLIVPVVKNADGMNLVGLSRSINDLGKRARIKKLSLDEIQGGTFTISNYGVFGNIIGTMVINQPQVAILGVGAVKKRPAVLETPNGDFVVIKPMMYLTVSFDHRLIDGALGGKFVMRVAHYLENYQV